METFRGQPARHHPDRTAPAPAISPHSDAEAWLNALRGSGSGRDQAVACLYAQLAAAARLEVARHATDGEALAGQAIDDLATHAADDALVAVLAELDDVRGARRFTTWACKFAILAAGRQARLHIWKHREVDLDSESWKRIAEPAGVGSSDHDAVLQVLTDGIGTRLGVPVARRPSRSDRRRGQARAARGCCIARELAQPAPAAAQLATAAQSIVSRRPRPAPGRHRREDGGGRDARVNTISNETGVRRDV